MFGFGGKDSTPDPAPAYAVDLDSGYKEFPSSSASFSESSVSDDADFQV